MPKFLVTYDLAASDPSPNKPFLDAAEKEDLLYIYLQGDQVFRLPNTTLWGEFSDRAAVRAAFDRALAAASQEVGYTIDLEKRFTTRIFSAGWVSDKKKAPEPEWIGANDLETCREHQIFDRFFDND